MINTEASSSPDRMNDTRDELRVALDRALTAIDCEGAFFCSGCLTDIHPGLTIDGLGSFGSPLYERDIRHLISGAFPADNSDAKRAWVIEGERVNFSHPRWAHWLNLMLERTCEQLGVSGGRKVVQAKLRKLSIYAPEAGFTENQ